MPPLAGARRLREARHGQSDAACAPAASPKCVLVRARARGAGASGVGRGLRAHGGGGMRRAWCVEGARCSGAGCGTPWAGKEVVIPTRRLLTPHGSGRRRRMRTPHIMTVGHEPNARRRGQKSERTPAQPHSAHANASLLKTDPRRKDHRHIQRAQGLDSSRPRSVSVPSDGQETNRKP